MKESVLNLDVVLEEAIGGEHRIYRHASAMQTSNVLTRSAESYCVPETDEELTLLECTNPKPWTFYNYFQLSSFLYTSSGVVVAGVVSLKEKAELINVLIEVLDKHTREIVATRALEVESKYNFRFEEVFFVKGKNAEQLLATVTATWRQGGKTEALTAVRERCIPKQFTQDSKTGAVICDTGNYTHIYPKKESSPVIFGRPEIHPHEPDYNQYDSQDEIVVSLLRLPEKRTDCDYICGFERGPNGNPYLAVPAKGSIDLRERKGKFVGVISRHCILTRCEGAGGATLLTRNETKIFENPNIICTYNNEKNIMTYDGTKSWDQEFDYPAGWDKVYHFDYDLTIDYEYKASGVSALDRLHVSSNFLFCDYHVPAIKIMYGCLAQDTLILMADGSSKRIDHIKTGDQIRGGIAGNKKLYVSNVWHGPEERLIRVEAGENTLNLTRSHPVLTTGGVVRASELKTGMEVNLATGNTEKVRVVEEVNYSGLVYNLSLEDETEPYLVAGGFIVGDMYLQSTAL